MNCRLRQTSATRRIHEQVIVLLRDVRNVADGGHGERDGRAR